MKLYAGMDLHSTNMVIQVIDERDKVLFMALMAERRIEAKIDKDLLADSRLLCSEATPEHCHRRLVAEYFREKWAI